MKKISIVTLQSINIGNRLQNFATQVFFEDLGYKVFTIDYYIKDIMIIRIKQVIKLLLYKLGKKKYLWDALTENRSIRFNHFSHQYIKYGRKVNYNKVKDDENVSFYIFGSDQIWHNWTRNRRELEFFYGFFTQPYKRISFSASFGLDTLEGEDLETHLKGLNELRAISCREKKACELVELYAGRESELLLDPTMLIPKENWYKLSRKPQYKIGKDFVLVYFLGEKTKEEYEYIHNFAMRKRCQIIDIFSDKCSNYYCTSPDEFIYLIENCRFVFTDSFHACVFSIIFCKDFLCFSRKQEKKENMESRMETLFFKFGIKGHFFGDKDYEKLDEKKIERILDEERKKAKDFFEEIMKS